MNLSWKTNALNAKTKDKEQNSLTGHEPKGHRKYDPPMQT